MIRMNPLVKIGLVVLATSLSTGKARSQTPASEFVKGIDTVMRSLKITGLYVVLKVGDKLLVDTGLGWANAEEKIKVTPQTTFRVASVTKTFTSTVVLQLVQKGLLNLDTPVSKYGIDLGNPAITVRHLLTHTSESVPGTWYHYNGYRFGLLTGIIEQVTGKKFYRVLTEQVLLPLHMNTSAPGIGLADYFRYADDEPSVTPNFRNASVNLAKPYGLNQEGKLTGTEYLNEFGAFGGLITNGHDLLLYSEAIDQHKLINEQVQQLAFSPEKLVGGASSPYGLGWFCQRFAGLDYYWHYGQTQGEGALFLKIPAKKLTLVVTANSERLSSPFPLGDGDIYSSPVAHLLYRYFLAPASDGLLDSTTFMHLRKKELITRAILAAGRGDSVEVRNIYSKYAEMFFKRRVVHLSGNVASLTNMGINAEKAATFKLARRTRLSVEGVGELCSPDGSSWCDYGWIQNMEGKTVWQMQGKRFTTAGGAQKNRRVSAMIELPAGEYTLKYRSDGGHAFNSWDDLPPEEYFWGIEVSVRN